MSIVNFDNVKITTMTVILDLEGEAIIEAAFPLFPITRLDLNNISRTKKKLKIPWPGKQYAGSIFSAKFSNITRGIIKTTSNKSFRNSVAIDICTSEKNVSAKLVKNKIHMCGPNSTELAVEAGQHIINHLKNIQDELDYIGTHLHDRDETIKWLINETRGECFTINEDTQEIVKLEEGESIKNSVVYDKNGDVKYTYKEIPFKWEPGDNVNPDNVVVNKYGQPYFRSLTKREQKDGITNYPIMIVGDVVKIDSKGDIPIDEKGNKFSKVCRVPLRVVEVTSVKIPKLILDSFENKMRINYPTNVNPRIASFFLQYLQDYAYHNVLCEFFSSFKEISRVFIPNSEEDILKIGNINIAMINYSYSLMMNVDRWALARLIDGHEGFQARYNNTTDHHVTVTLPYEKNEDETINRKGNTSISWMIYKSGIVTQSGPSPELMRPTYYKFMEFINSVRDQIGLKDGRVFKIKFKSSKSEEISL